MKLIKDGDFKNKIVLTRCDFNVSLSEKGGIDDDFRVVKTLPTIEFLIKSGAAAVLMSHLEIGGKPASLRPVAKYLGNALGAPVKFLDDCVGDKIMAEIKKAKPGQVLLLENLRFHAGEKTNDPEFARQLAKMGDCYVNEAFSCSHRDHASISGVPRHLPAYAGILFQNEIANLEKIVKKPRRPLTVVIGGVKVESKAKTISNFIKVADHVLIGSKIGAQILAHQRQLAGAQAVAPDPVVGAIDITSPKLHLPVDGVLALKDLSEGYSRAAAVGLMRQEEDIFDIGPETSKFFAEIIAGSKTIFFNGPMGMFEKHDFAAGTKAVLEAIAAVDGAYRVAGGGQTLEAIRKFGVEKKFNFLSTGGGAMLEFLAGNKLPGIQALG